MVFGVFRQSHFTTSRILGDIKCDSGNKFDTVDKEVTNIKATADREIGAMKQEFQQKWSVIHGAMDNMNKIMLDMQAKINSGTGYTQNGSQTKSILQDKAVSQFEKNGKRQVKMEKLDSQTQEYPGRYNPGQTLGILDEKCGEEL